MKILPEYTLLDNCFRLLEKSRILIFLSVSFSIHIEILVEIKSQMWLNKEPFGRPWI